MKTQRLNLWTAVMAISFFGATGWSQSSAQILEKDEKAPALLTVSGRGEVKARPDYAVLRLGVEAQEEEAAVAQEAVNLALQQAIKQIKRLNIPDEAIQTSGLSLGPIYGPQSSNRERDNNVRLVGYRASNLLHIRVKDLKVIGKVIDGVIKSGGNRLEGITFGLSDDLAQRSNALKLAAEEAQVKARILAEAMRVRLGPVHRIQEGGVVVQPQMVAFARMEYARSASTPIEPGEIQVEATVTIEYRIETSNPNTKR